jgi:hypothetical protein
MFGRFEANLASGERLRWDECSPDWIAGVAGTGTPLLHPGGLGQVPGLADRVGPAYSPLEQLRVDEPAALGAIQFFEAQIDDQLLPRAYYDDLLTRHGFTDPGSASITLCTP